jgi:hypothetical protein
MKSKIVKLINVDSKGNMGIQVDDMNFLELVQAWTFFTKFIFNICEGEGNGKYALNGGDKEGRECKAIFYPVFKEWVAYLKQVKDK